MNKKVIALTVIAFCALIFPTYKSFAKISLDDAFRGGTNIEYIKFQTGPFVTVRTLKFAWASTRKEENGIETYEGRHYLRCYRQSLFSGTECDTGRVWKDRGFYLESGRCDISNGPAGGFKACYGDEND